MPITPWSVAGLGALGYVVGGIPVGWLLVRWGSHLDIRALGTGNIGTSNIYRNAGTGVASLVGPLQFAQGLAPVLVARWLGAPTWLWALAGVCAVIGNGWPVYLGLRGGRGVAVTTGVVAGLGALPLAILLAAYLAGFLAHRIALGVFAGMLTLPVVGYLSDGLPVAMGLAAVLGVIIARRMEGLLQDFHDRPHERLPVLTRRLFLDERPGQRLVGPNGEGAGGGAAHQTSS
ncbi:MAG: glycerol-3-phosphate acyltransferase [Candidatus Dormibacteraceae bacterium]